MTTALMMDGNTLTPVWVHMTTKGDDAAVWPPSETASRSRGEYWLTLRPMTRVDRT